MWQKACREALQGGSLGGDCEPEYELMLRLLAGDVGAFDILKGYADMWCQLLVARLLYTNPLARFFDLQVIVTACPTSLTITSLAPMTALDMSVIMCMSVCVRECVRVGVCVCMRARPSVCVSVCCCVCMCASQSL